MGGYAFLISLFWGEALMSRETGRTKKALVDLVKKILKTDINLDFLLKLEREELEILIACIRDKVS
jgi:hypothetical protein